MKNFKAERQQRNLKVFKKLLTKIRFFDRDYSWLKGYEVIVNTSDGRTYDCFVAQADPRKGLSIVDINNPDDEIFCINKAAHFDLAISAGHPALLEYSKYIAVFCYTVKAVQAGVVEGRFANAIGNKELELLKLSGMGDFPGCAFK